MAMIAHKCPDIEVVVVDINAARIAAWNSEVGASCMASEVSLALLASPGDTNRVLCPDL